MEYLYIISISFQIAGAVLLMINSLSIKRNSVIKRFFNHKITVLNGNTNEVEYDEEEFKNAFKEAYLTGFSFAYICLGYIIGIFGTIEDSCKCCIMLGIIILTTVLIIMAYLLTKCIIRKSSEINKKITKKELDKLGIKTDMESISNKEIDDILKI